IVPDHGPLVDRRPEIRAAVQEIRRIAECQEALRDAGRNPQHAPVLLGESHSDPAAVGWRAATHVDGHIEDFAPDDADQLSLGLLYLIVQAPQGMSHRTAVIVLHEPHAEPGGGKLAHLPGLEEKAPRIAEDSRVNHDDIGNLGRLEFHGEHRRPGPQASPRTISMRYVPYAVFASGRASRSSCSRLM